MAAALSLILWHYILPVLSFIMERCLRSPVIVTILPNSTGIPNSQRNAHNPFLETTHPDNGRVSEQLSQSQLNYKGVNKAN